MLFLLLLQCFNEVGGDFESLKYQLINTQKNKKKKRDREREFDTSSHFKT